MSKFFSNQHHRRTSHGPPAGKSSRTNQPRSRPAEPAYGVPPANVHPHLPRHDNRPRQRHQPVYAATQPQQPRFDKARARDRPQPSRKKSWSGWRMIRWLGLITLVALLLFMLVFAGFGLVASASHPFWEWRSLATASRAVELLDSRGRVVGATAGAVASLYDQNRTVVPVGLADLPPFFSELLVATEDRRFGQLPCWILGVDVCGFAARATRLQGGASTLPMQLLSNLGGMKEAEASLARNYRDSGAYTEWLLWKAHVVKRKASELALAPQVLIALCGARLGAEPYRECFVPVYATHVPFAIGPSGTIYGLVDAAQATWGKPPAALSPAQSAILVAAAQSPILLVPRSSGKAALARERWRTRVIPRARLAAALAFPDPNDPVRRRIVRELDRLEHSPPYARGTVHGIEVDFMDGVGLHQRRETLVSSIADIAAHELKSLDSGSAVRSVRLTVEVHEEDTYKRVITNALASVSGRLRGRLCLDISGAIKDFRPAAFCPPAARSARAEVFAMTVDEVGRIETIYSSRKGLVDEAVPVGSLTKVAAVLAVADEDAQATPWCVDAACEQHISARDAIAFSHSSAVYERLRVLDPAKLKNIASMLGFELVQGASPSRALAYGMAETSPRNLAEIFSCLYAATSRHRMPAPPHSLIEVETPKGWEALPQRVSERCHAVARLVKNDRARIFVEATLGAVARYGTLRLMEGRGLGKTGTPTSTVVPGQPAQAKLAAGTYPTGNGSRTWVLSVQAPWTTPLGMNLDTTRFADLVRAAARTGTP